MRILNTILLILVAAATCLAQWTTSGTNIYNTNSGNVGIGISTPAQKVDLVGRFKFRSDSYVSSGGWFTGLDGSESAFFGQTGNNGGDPLGIWHGNAWRFAVTGTGNVGIGTTAPTAKLTLQNSASGLNSGILFVDGVNNQRGAIYYDGGQNLVIDALSGPGGADVSTFKLRAGGADRLTVTRDGNVGIGTNLNYNPNNYKLAVKGKIGAQEIMVETTSSTWADYVFDPNYHLMPLNQVETFVKSNHHLPEIPSANDIKENGHKLGEMDVLLLKKIEELTLYILELEKRIAALENKIQK